ncbi:MAG TPA: prepilin-type N-terminal cleavage/methylation domain-containing protein [Gemmatimonadaceae bacterium]|nr:prepilin-type N-terminal cleavage/methylation domain-containing protein [Gemmatimonadaceae bacterium]
MRSPRPLRSENGITLVEILVSLVVLSVGLLGVAATAIAVTRLTSGGTRRTLAAAAASSRLEGLRNIACARAASGRAVARGIEELWTVAPAGGVAVMADSLFYVADDPRKGGPLRRSDVFQVDLLC